MSLMVSISHEMCFHSGQGCTSPKLLINWELEQFIVKVGNVLMSNTCEDQKNMSMYDLLFIVT